MALPEPPRVMVLTTFDRSDYVVRTLRAGAYGFLLEDAPSSRLVAEMLIAETTVKTPVAGCWPTGPGSSRGRAERLQAVLRAPRARPPRRRAARAGA